MRLPFWREPVWPQLPNHRQQQQQREVILLVAWYEPDVPLARIEAHLDRLGMPGRAGTDFPVAGVHRQAVRIA